MSTSPQFVTVKDNRVRLCSLPFLFITISSLCVHPHDPFPYFSASSPLLFSPSPPPPPLPFLPLLHVFPPPVSLITLPLIPEEMVNSGFTVMQDAIERTVL